MTKDDLPRPDAELARIARHYGATETLPDHPQGRWVDPRPMVTTSLRLPASLVHELRAQAEREGVRYTALIRRLLEAHFAQDVQVAALERIRSLEERVARLEQPRAS